MVTVKKWFSVVMIVLLMSVLGGCAAPVTVAPTDTPEPTDVSTSTPAPTDTPVPTATAEPTETPLPPTETPTPEPTIGAFNDDIAYAGTRNKQQTLSVHLPKFAEPPYPTVLIFHSGGFVGGNRNEVLEVAEYLSGKGYAAISAGYRLGYAYPKAVNDAFCALAWTFAEAERYGLDSGNVVVMGFSAGADLSALLGLIQDRAAYLADCPHILTSDDKVASVVGYAGSYNELALEYFHPDAVEATDSYLQSSRPGWEERAIAASPVTYIHSEAPPFLLLHGELDNIVNIGASRDFLAALLAQGVEAQLIEVPGVDHIDLEAWRATSSDSNYWQTPERIQMDDAVEFINGLE